MLNPKPDLLRAGPPPPSPSSLSLRVAAEFTVADLTEIYNRSRVDYVVPMPMNEAKLREYIHAYDVDLGASVVAMDDDEPLGIGMLGVRGEHTWITRLGVIPAGRQRGVGRALMMQLITNSINLGATRCILEVIKDNLPAQRLFESLGFQFTRELRVIRRPPISVAVVAHASCVEPEGYQQAVSFLGTRTDQHSWVTATASMLNAGNLSALVARIRGGGRGWLVYQNTVFQLARLVLHTEGGDPVEIARTLLQNLHWRHPVQDTIVENMAVDDPHYPAFSQMGYLVSFSRQEMWLSLC